MGPRCAAFILLLFAAPAARGQERMIVQHSEGAGATNIGVVQGSVTINGIDPSILTVMAQTFAGQVAATAEARAQAEAKAAELATKLGVTTAATAAFFRTLGEQRVPEEDIAARLLQIADQFAKTKQGLAALEPEDPQSAALVEKAGEALNSGRLAEASDLLRQAQAIEMAALRQARELRQRAQEAEDRHARKVAGLLAGQGGIAGTQLQYARAADAYEQAADALPAGQASERAKYLSRAAAACLEQTEAVGEEAFVRRAIADLGRALTLVPRRSDPLQSAELEVILGRAWTKLYLRTHSPEDFDQARRSFGLALEVVTRESAPGAWGSAQNGLGNLNLAAGSHGRGTATLLEAVRFYRAGAEVNTRVRAPELWGALQDNIGMALRLVGARNSRVDILREAVAAHELALTVRTRDIDGAKWAKSHVNIARALLDLSQQLQDPAEARSALDHLALAEQVVTRSARPYGWALLQFNRAHALALLSAQKGTAEQLEQAISAQRAALEVITPEVDLFEWAVQQNNLGRLIYQLGRREKRSDLLLQAVQIYRSALDRIERDRATRSWDNLQLNLADALLEVGLNETGTENLERAAAAYRVRLQHVDGVTPRAQAMITRSLARALAKIGIHLNDPARLLEADAEYDRAASLFTRGGALDQAAALRSERAGIARRPPP